MNYNLPQTSMIKIQKQKQIDELEQKYVVFQDLKNFLCIVTETHAVLEMLGSDHELSRIHLNRLICQLNLSNSIHADTFLNSQKYHNSDSLKIIKNNGIALYNQFKEQYYDQLDPKIQGYVKLYELNALNNNGCLQQIPIQFTKQQNFTNESLQTLINAFAEVDQVYQDIREGKYEVDQSYESFNKILQMKSVRAREKIADFIIKQSQNIPKQQNTPKQKDIKITQEWKNLLQYIVEYSASKNQENKQMLLCIFQSVIDSTLTIDSAINQNITQFIQLIRNQDLRKYMIQLQNQLQNRELDWQALERINLAMFQMDMDHVQKQLKN